LKIGDITSATFTSAGILTVSGITLVIAGSHLKMRQTLVIRKWGSGNREHRV
jgi:hypothetical protein